MRFRLFLVVLVCSASAYAQFDLGVSGGGYVYELWEHDPQSGRSSASFSSAQAFPWSIGLNYREQGPQSVRFATGFQFVHREFSAQYAGGGMGSGYDKWVDVSLDMLYWNLHPEIRLSERGNMVLRTGLQFGWLLNSAVEGRSISWSQGSGSTPPSNTETEVKEQFASDFKGDTRFLVGLGFRVPLGERTFLTVDPYWNTALSSLLNDNELSISSRGCDAGILVGLAWQQRGLGFWRGLKAGSPRRLSE